MAEKVFSFEEVAKHRKMGDCWVFIHGKVYDVSRFLQEHPGGDEVMLNTTGRDATPDFEDIGHTTYAQGKMKEFLIGSIDESTVPKTKAFSTASSSSKMKKNIDDSSSSFLLYVLPLLIMGVAFLLRFYSKND